MGTRLTIPLPIGFRLADAVCSYGYFILAPNRWQPGPRRGTGELHTALHDAAGHAVFITLRQRTRTLAVLCDRKLGPTDRDAVRQQVRRMLRLDEDFADWHRVHPAAAAARFDRLFRSPTLFEDIVKTMTGCNVSWPNTVRMNRLLCDEVGGGAFPTPTQLAATDPAHLQARCKVGYRAQRIVRLARDVIEGRLDLAGFESPDRTTDELYDTLRKIHGIGDYAANNVLQLLGRYDRLAVDSETLRHFRQLHHVTGDLKKITAKARRYYQRFAPYQFLAYWFELWQDYQRRVGPADRWNADDHLRFTAAQLKPDAACPTS